jgi:hypothetical protein
MPHPKRTHGGLSNHGKGFGQDVIQGLPFADPFSEDPGFCLQPLITQRPNFQFQAINPVNYRLELFKLPFVLAAKNSMQKASDHLTKSFLLRR